jgi:hypothetical protein
VRVAGADFSVVRCRRTTPRLLSEDELSAVAARRTSSASCGGAHGSTVIAASLWSPSLLVVNGYGYQYEWPNLNGGCIQSRWE